MHFLLFSTEFINIYTDKKWRRKSDRVCANQVSPAKSLFGLECYFSNLKVQEHQIFFVFGILASQRQLVPWFVVNEDFNPIFHCPSLTGPWVFWMFIAQNIIMYKKYELNMHSFRNVFCSFLLQGSLRKMKLWVLFMKLVHTTQQVRSIMANQSSEILIHTGNLNSPHVSTAPNQPVILHVHLSLVASWRWAEGGWEILLC